MKTHQLWALCPALLCLTATQANAATIHVTTLDTTTTTDCTLYDAIVAAETDAPSGNCIAGQGHDEIVLTPGSYGLYPSEELGRAAALPEITTEITLTGAGATIHRHEDSSQYDVVFTILKVGNGGVLNASNLTIDDGWQRGLIIDGGTASLDEVTLTNNRWGAILLKNHGDLTVTNSTIAKNISYYNETVGGIQILNGSRLRISNSEMYNNGGAIAHGRGHFEETPNTDTNAIIVEDSKIYSNGTKNYAAINIGNATLTVTNTEITNNGAYYVGAVSVGDQAVIIDNSIIANSSTEYGAAAGIEAGKNTKIRNSIIHNNSCINFCVGGISAPDGVIIENTTISYNRGTFGGGILTDGYAEVKNSTIIENTITPYLEDPDRERRYSGGIASTVNAKISANPITLQNTIITNNHGGYWQCAEDLTEESGNNYVSDSSCDSAYSGEDSPFLTTPDKEVITHYQPQPTHLVATSGNINSCTERDALGTVRLSDGTCSLGTLEYTSPSNDDSESATTNTTTGTGTNETTQTTSSEDSTEITSQPNTEEVAATDNETSANTNSETTAEIDSQTTNSTTAVLNETGEINTDNSNSQESGGGALHASILLLLSIAGITRRRLAKY